MPFTASHVAAVLPVLGRGDPGLPATGLVVGSMIPDLPLYLPHSAYTYDRAHSLVGVFTIDVLAGLVVVAVWHVLLGPAAVQAAPDVVRRKLQPPGRLRPDPRLVVALVLGALTHVTWDAFTHPGRWGTRHIAWLREQHGPFAGYHWGQYASGVFGGLVVLVWAGLWWRRTPPGALTPGLSRHGRRVAWAAVVGAGAAGALFGMASGLHAASGAQQTLVLMATHGGAAAGVAALVTAGVVRARVPVTP